MNDLKYEQVLELITRQQLRLKKITSIIDHMDELLEVERKELDSLYLISINHEGKEKMDNGEN